MTAGARERRLVCVVWSWYVLARVLFYIFHPRRGSEFAKEPSSTCTSVRCTRDKCAGRIRIIRAVCKLVHARRSPRRYAPRTNIERNAIDARSFGERVAPTTLSRPSPSDGARSTLQGVKINRPIYIGERRNTGGARRKKKMTGDVGEGANGNRRGAVRRLGTRVPFASGRT